ncbi:MAG: DNA repair protein RecN [Bacteroidaceae bacterium]|nr:DNA repair protein RecN [Bacteroidaceae bacterium]
MLQALYIKNYALISELDIDFHKGFSVITGETGAGKSILLGAIGLLLGQRADIKAIKQGEQRCIIEARFDLTGCGLEQFFNDNDLDYNDGQCIVRRELTASGKSRAFINDTPVQVAQLKQLGSQLLDIHSQHQNLLLGQEDFQLNVVDIIAHDKDELEQYTILYNRYRSLQQQLSEALQAASKGKDEADYLQFQLSQIDELNLQPDQQAEMEQEAQLLSHAEEVKGALYSAYGAVSGGDDGSGTTDALRQAARMLNNISDMLPQASPLASRIESCQIELSDIADEILQHAERTDVNPSRLQAVNEWLGQLYGILQKHHLNSDAELLELAADLRSQLDAIEGSEEQIERLQKEMDEALRDVMTQGEKLSKLRRQAADAIEAEMQQRLVPLGIPNARISISLTHSDTPLATGLDIVKILFSANKNSALQDIATVASGGEIARVMLSLKALISASVSLPTIIFDEIDTGVSGHIAESMASTMRQMGDGGRQVLAITHLPQIAALGQHHYRVYKEDSENDTTSHIVELDLDGRVNEIAHMLSGTQLTDAAIGNAKALLQAGQK